MLFNTSPLYGKESYSSISLYDIDCFDDEEDEEEEEEMYEEQSLSIC